MTGTRVVLLVVVAAVLAPRAEAGIFGRGKGKSDSQVRQLVVTLRTDGDEKKRRAAAAELRDADPRSQADVIPALTAALRLDPAAQVRADAADALGSYRVVFPVAGAALEAASETDPSPVVRDMAKQTLWEYHLLGYRSSRGADGFLGQTAEPRVAARPAPRPPAVLLPPAPAVVPVRVDLPPTAPSVSAYRPPTADEFPAPAPAGPRIIFTTAPPFRLNVTDEPPYAARK